MGALSAQHMMDLVVKTPGWEKGLKLGLSHQSWVDPKMHRVKFHELEKPPHFGGSYTGVCVCVYMLSHVRLFATPCTVALQAPLSMGFSRKEYWRKLPFPSLGDLPQPSDHTSVSCISCIGRWILYS